VAALAYGTQTIAAVAKIVGPGNAWVAAAKRRVFGTVGIDMIAGPSEVLVLADGSANPDWIAMDLMAQAEHDTAAQSILITDDAGLADAVVAAVERALTTLPRRAIAEASWRDFGAIILVESLEKALPLVDRLAPEHLEIMAENADALSAGIRNAGAIFLGGHTPEAIGDYVGGSNHVLPTGSTARFTGGLSVLHFLRVRTWLRMSDGPDARAMAADAAALARLEGLEAHARSADLRARPPQTRTGAP
jgi:histidinol dehydrogenase